ncbi:MAG: hypothetical protein NT007_10030 [Candidatus Kapabacteria bacterium]|nr:hypothetical protein [Candidatus Kapabacteria bacterium]
MLQLKNNCLFFCIVIAFFFNFSLKSFSQLKLDHWRVYTSIFKPADATMDSKGRLWIATAGAVYIFDYTKKVVVKELRKTEGLTTMDISAIKADTAKKIIFIGGRDGSLDIFDEDFKYTNITTIKNIKTFPNPIINDFFIYDSVVYIAGGFGLTVFHSNSMTFGETITRFGEFQTNNIAYKIQINKHKIWLATGAGLAYCDVDSVYPYYQWKTYNEKNGLTVTPLKYLTIFNDTVFVGSQTTQSNTSDIIYKMKNDSFSVVTKFEYGTTSLESKGDQLYFSDRFFIYNKDKNAFDFINPSNIATIRLFNYHSDNFILVLYTDLAIGIIKDKKLDTIFLNSARTSNFFNLSIDKNNNFWASTFNNGSGSGIMHFDGERWFNFHNGNTKNQGISGSFDVFNHPDGRIFVSSWGSGFFIGSKTDTGYSFKNYNDKNVPFIGLGAVTGMIAMDSKQDVWISVYDGQSVVPGPLFVKIDKNNNVTGFENLSGANKREYLNMVIDQNDSKWLAAGSARGQGLYGFNENGDKFKNILTSNSQIPLNYQNCLVVDKNGMLWIGSQNGISVLNNTNCVTFNTNPIIRKEIPAMRSKTITCLMADALNNIWVGTNTGLWVLDNDGNPITYTDSNNISQQAFFNSLNSPIPDDFIQCLSTNENNGKVYIGTKFGMAEVQTLGLKASDSYTLDVYPQPYFTNNTDGVIIKGLAPFTDLRILTIDGKLIKRLNTSGDVVNWNGRDEAEHAVSTGIYIILANSQTSNLSSVGKISIINGSSPKK